uniref:Uncharacterized protein LOC111120560 n=1 Tax=Crassostrea virginica TaxID=6565 RepID=A0A8B8CRL3_CRAVI|nr:uncharacterized protein LOC111120560 [Crassostrea virginica]
MTTMGMLTTLVWILLLHAAITVEAIRRYRRLCHHDEVDVGIRRAPQDAVATHTCVPGPSVRTCLVMDAAEGFNCTGDFHLQGGLPNRRNMCCNRMYHQLFECSVPLRTFSYMQGFDIQLRSGVIRSIIPSPTAGDITTFRLEICSLLPVTFDSFGRKK